MYNIYINIKLIFDLSKIYFGTATLQHCNAAKIFQNKTKKKFAGCIIFSYLCNY